MKVLFVCTGNICRSPTAEGVFLHLARQAGLSVQADSAGTHDYHVGDPPDERAIAHAGKRGYDLSALRARQVNARDFEDYDLVLAMDRGHHAQLLRRCPEGLRHKLRLYLEFAPEFGAEDVPDPYYEGPEAFEQVLDMVEAATRRLLDHSRTYLLSRDVST